MAEQEVGQCRRFLGAGQRGFDGLQLVQDVDAVTIAFDHLRDPANLPFDPAEAVDDPILC